MLMLIIKLVALVAAIWFTQVNLFLFYHGRVATATSSAIQAIAIVAFIYLQWPKLL
jgi:hypothetical protein